MRTSGPASSIRLGGNRVVLSRLIRNYAHEVVVLSGLQTHSLNRVAFAIARKTGRFVGLDTATRMAMDADFSVRDDGIAPKDEPFEETDPLDELMRIVSETPARPPYRIQFVGGEFERGTSVLKEIGLRASDPSEAVREASRLRWPTRAVGFRLIDREGREVFGRNRR